jgi:hypothetical protein
MARGSRCARALRTRRGVSRQLSFVLYNAREIE